VKRSLATLLAVGLALAACGGSGSDDTADQSDAVVVTEAPVPATKVPSDGPDAAATDSTVAEAAQETTADEDADESLGGLDSDVEVAVRTVLDFQEREIEAPDGIGELNETGSFIPEISGELLGLLTADVVVVQDCT